MALSKEALAILEARKAKQAAQKGSDTQAPQRPAKPVQQEADFSGFDFGDLVPNLDSRSAADAAPSEEQDAEAQLDRFIEGLSIAEAYKKFCGKAPIKWSGADENNMISCPRLDHEDKKPSAWFNISKKLWDCGSCLDGGGVIDLVGATLGIPDKHTRKGKSYHDIRRHIARAYGWTVYKRLDGTMGVVPPGTPTRTQSAGGAFAKLLRSAPAAAPVSAPPPTEERTPAPAAEAESSGPHVSAAPKAPILHLVQPDSDADVPESDDESDVQDINWREVFAEDSFVRAYMEATSNDDSPEMYHLWSALVALGMTTGRKVTLWDSPSVYGNLSICLLGHTGQGKSRSRVPLLRLLDEMMPYDPEEIVPEGAAQVINPKTGEGLTAAFARPIRTKDPKTGQIITSYPGGVKGIAMFEEFSEIVALVARGQSTLDTVIMAGCDCGSAKMGGTTKGDGMFVADDHYMSAWSSTQPNRLQDLFKSSDKESGFLNRWVFVAGTPKPRSTFNHGPAADLTRAMNQYKMVRDVVNSRGTYAYELLPDAMEEFDHFIQKVVLPEMDKGSPMIQRMNLIMKKLLLLLSVNAHQDKVTVDIVRQAKAFYPYLLDTYALIDRSVGVPTKGDLEYYIMELIQKYQSRPKKPKEPELMTLGMLRTKTRNNPLVKHIGFEAVLKALEILEKLGEVAIHEPKAGKLGKPTKSVEALA